MARVHGGGWSAQTSVSFCRGNCVAYTVAGKFWGWVRMRRHWRHESYRVALEMLPSDVWEKDACACTPHPGCGKTLYFLFIFLSVLWRYLLWGTMVLCVCIPTCFCDKKVCGVCGDSEYVLSVYVVCMVWVCVWSFTKQGRKWGNTNETFRALVGRSLSQ